ncbi:unnamed protein product [Mytilus coruscus]|uniref:G-protein coupled receptors family 1 profile domain-containing protein n=1 Tax=Mytilus coruscus TaxID=42192 RepID=A0A6J8B3N2_MYTCO|nr:unnamed protein product [Mytilus coruscus]
MGSLDWMSKELKPFLHQVKVYELNIDLRKYLWYSPKEQYSDTEITYILYIHPILVAVSLCFFICLVSIVKEEKTFKPYIFLLLQALFDLLGITVQSIPMWMVFVISDKNDYIPFQYCEVYRTFTVFIQQSLYIISQWMKVFMTVHQFAIFYFSVRAKSMVSKTRIVLSIVVVTCILIPLTVVTKFVLKFAKAYYRNTETGSIEYYCKIVHYQIIGEYRNLITFVVNDFLPLVAYIVFGVGLSYQIQKRRILRRQLQNNQSTDTSLENLARAHNFSAFIFVFTSLPCFAVDLIAVYNSFGSEKLSFNEIENTFNALLILKNVCQLMNITAVVLVNLCLNRDMRQTLINKFRTLVPCLRYN